MKLTGDKRIDDLVRAARRAGWRVERRSSHLMCYAPNRSDIVTVSVSSSDPYAFKKIAADFRRAGFEVAT